LAQGFAVEILGAPNNASLNGKRQTEAYADTIGRAVAFARTRASAPVWLVGTSAGTTGAANGAARLTGRVAGLALTSSVTRQNSGGETVFDTNLAAIMVPVLIVANQNDACPVTPPGDAPRIARRVRPLSTQRGGLCAERNVGKNTDRAGRMAWLKNYCRNHPLDQNITAVIELRKYLAK